VRTRNIYTATNVNKAEERGGKGIALCSDVFRIDNYKRWIEGWLMNRNKEKWS
jgi:hypothetical protein